MLIPAETLNYLIFVIPGFALVWTFRYFTRSERQGEFELAGLSFLAGMITLGITQWTTPPDKFTELIKNPYAIAGAFSIIAFILGLFVAFVKKIFNFDLRAIFDWIIKYVRNENN